MMYFKHRKPGFSFIEVICALAAASTLLIALFNLQTTIMRAVVAAKGRFERTMLVKNLLQEAVEHGWSEDKNAVQQRTEEGKEMKYEMRQVDERSSLHEQRDMVWEVAEVRWVSKGINKVEQMVRLLFKPENKNNEKGL
jgi:Tfp pilus assembly protein PilV